MYFVTAFIFLGHKYKGHDFIRAGAFAPLAPFLSYAPDI